MLSVDNNMSLLYTSHSLSTHNTQHFTQKKYHRRDYGRWVSNGYFFRLAHFSKDMKDTFSTRWLAISIKAIAALLIIFRAPLNILFLIDKKILVLTKWSPPQILGT